MGIEKNENKLEWYDNAYCITNLIIALIFLIIILSQSFAINNNLSMVNIFTDIINHICVYLLLLFYFISLKFKFGKKYFDYFNLFLIIIYFIVSLTSLLTVFNSFMLDMLLDMALNFTLFSYLFHTLLKNTRLWKEFKLNRSPFNELSNEWYFATIIVLSVTLLALGLISTSTIPGAILCFLDCMFSIFFGRYIFLYKDYIDSKEVIEKNNKIKNSVSKKVDEISDKIENFVEENKIDEKIDDVKEKIVSTSKEVKEKVDDFIEDSNIDEKIDFVKEKVSTTVKEKIDDLKENKNNNSKKVKDYVKKERSQKGDK